MQAKQDIGTGMAAVTAAIGMAATTAQILITAITVKRSLMTGNLNIRYRIIRIAREIRIINMLRAIKAIRAIGALKVIKVWILLKRKLMYEQIIMQGLLLNR